MSAITRRPTRLGSGIAVLVAVTALATLLAPPSVGTLVAAPGVALLGLGLLQGRRAPLTAGAGLVFVGVLVHATTVTDPLLPLVGAAASVVAWDVGEHAISLGEQLGREAPTRQASLTHAAASGLVGLATAGGAFVVYTATSRGQPLAALVLLLFAAVVLTSALRR